MGLSDEWDAQKMLDRYVLDYMIKNDKHEAAEIFRKEAGVSPDPVVLNAPRGFLHEWWSIFYDMYNSSQTKFQQERTQQRLHNIQLQNTQPATPQVQMNQPLNEQFLVNHELNRILGGVGPNPLGPINYEKEQFRHLLGEHDPSFRYVKLNELNVPDSAAASSSNLQQQFCNQAQQSLPRENINGFSFEGVMNQDPAFWGMQEGISPITKPQGSEVSRLINSVPMTGRPLDKPELLAEESSRIPGNYAYAFPESSSKLVHQNLTLPRSDVRVKNPQTKVKKRIVAQTRQIIEKNQECDQLQQKPLPENDKRRNPLSDSKAKGKALDATITQQSNPVDESVESFLSNDYLDADGKNPPFGILGYASSDKKEEKGFSFEEVGCLHSSKSKVLCCHFSSDGKLLASAGQDKKLLIWNAETFDFTNTSEGHSALITDVRFGSNSNILATSSFDRTVQVWNTARPIKPLLKLLGHSEHVMSLDFHPRRPDLLCSCDSNSEIRYWNMNTSACIRTSKGATKQVRFQPDSGQILATSAGNCLNIINVETDSVLVSMEGHEKEIQSVCWDPSGKYIFSVSEDSVRVWSAATGGECMHKLLSNGNKYQSCAFHPTYSECLVIGGYQTIELWNPAESNKTLAVQAHKGLVSSLSSSQENKMIASTSHDQCVKLWK